MHTRNFTAQVKLLALFNQSHMLELVSPICAKLCLGVETSQIIFSIQTFLVCWFQSTSLCSN